MPVRAACTPTFFLCAFGVFQQGAVDEGNDPVLENSSREGGVSGGGLGGSFHAHTTIPEWGLILLLLLFFAVVQWCYVFYVAELWLHTENKWVLVGKFSGLKSFPLNTPRLRVRVLVGCIQESTNEDIHQWTNKSMSVFVCLFLSCSPSLFLSKINLKETQ